MIKLILLPLILVVLSGCKGTTDTPRAPDIPNMVRAIYPGGLECAITTYRDGISCNWEKYNADRARPTGTEEFIQ